MCLMSKYVKLLMRRNVLKNEHEKFKCAALVVCCNIAPLFITLDVGLSIAIFIIHFLTSNAFRLCFILHK